MRKTRRLLGLFIILMLLVKCTPFDYEGKLPNGYEMNKTSSTNIAIARGLTVFRGDINRMNIRGNIVIGRVDELPSEEQRTRTSKFEAPPGYFILDTKTGSFQLGLEKEAWLRQLKKVGISEEPNLKMPTAFASEPFLILNVPEPIQSQPGKPGEVLGKFRATRLL
ncbi:hypothetical protein [Leptolyngbya sp. 7M]|uniref:hypothetical protein n=1 Tax=Leptolyngbya sp. 7M TaxID=2812896 RepID=UPI001B8C59E9|nr:hypothetical protein [Leptolyngbya sp. 7M]QYO64135.1 hypothetical protein JVX88_30990 [Leptolyngbya sp. 7M]